MTINDFPFVIPVKAAMTACGPARARKETKVISSQAPNN